MTKQALTIYQFLRNGEEYAYPWRESLLSAYPVADEIVVAECFSSDATWKELQEFASDKPKIKLLRHRWVTNFKELAHIGNFCIANTKTSWHWQLQADEVIHEDSYEEIRNLVETAPSLTTAAKVHYTHFLANYGTLFPFIYQELVRIARGGQGWRLTGDACQLDGGDRRSVVDTNIQVYHYGKVKEGSVGYKKEWDFQQLYTEIGFPDPKMLQMKDKFGAEYCDYVYLFEDAVRRGEVKKFMGTHPKTMQERVARSKLEGWEQFVSKMKDDLKL